MTCTPSARPRSRSAVSSSGSRRQGPTAWRTYPTSGRSRKSRGCIAESDLALARTQEEGAASGCGDDEDDVQRRIWPARRHDDFRERPLVHPRVNYSRVICCGEPTPGGAVFTVEPIALTEDERTELERRAGAHTSTVRAARRAKVILLCADGVPLRRIATTVGMDQHQVGQWRRRFLAARLGGLADQA